MHEDIFTLLLCISFTFTFAHKHTHIHTRTHLDRDTCSVSGIVLSMHGSVGCTETLTSSYKSTLGRRWQMLCYAIFYFLPPTSLAPSLALSLPRSYTTSLTLFKLRIVLCFPARKFPWLIRPSIDHLRTLLFLRELSSRMYNWVLTKYFNVFSPEPQA